jgi:hypothetical protein
MKKLIALIGICCLKAADVRVDLTQPGKKVSPNLFWKRSITAAMEDSITN